MDQRKHVEPHAGGDPARTRPRHSFGTTRIGALADGVFSIAMTLLVLEIKLPRPTADDAEGISISSRMLLVWPKFATYALSFMVCGVFWISHQSLMHFVKRSDRVFLWLNVFFLMVVSAIPFSAALLGDYHPDPAAITVYCGNLFVCGLIQLAQMVYAFGPADLHLNELDPKLVRLARNRLAMGPVLYLIAMLICRTLPNAAMLICAATLVLYMIPGKIDRYLIE